MKTFKKITSVCMAFLVMAVLMISSTSMVFAADEVDETIKTTLVSTSEQLTDAVLALTDEDIENYINSDDAFTASAMQAWNGSKDELGAKTETNGDATVILEDGQYIVTLPLKFEKADAEFIYTYDSTGTPTSLSVDVQYSMAESLKRAGLNTAMGIGTVFVMLVLLSLLISLFRFIPTPEKKKADAAKAAKAQQDTVAADTSSVQTIEEDVTDDKELIAVIAAAIAAVEGTSTDAFVVRSIRKVKRNKR